MLVRRSYKRKTNITTPKYLPDAEYIILYRVYRMYPDRGTTRVKRAANNSPTRGGGGDNQQEWTDTVAPLLLNCCYCGITRCRRRGIVVVRGVGCRRYNKYDLPVVSMTLASHRWRLVVALEHARTGAGADARAGANGGRPPPPPRPSSSSSSRVALERARAGADARAGANGGRPLPPRPLSSSSSSSSS
jgi:hypothetical protein